MYIPTCVYAHHLHTGFMQDPEKDVISPETEVADACELPCKS